MLGQGMKRSAIPRVVVDVLLRRTGQESAMPRQAAYLRRRRSVPVEEKSHRALPPSFLAGAAFFAGAGVFTGFDLLATGLAGVAFFAPLNGFALFDGLAALVFFVAITLRVF